MRLYYKSEVELPIKPDFFFHLKIFMFNVMNMTGVFLSFDVFECLKMPFDKGTFRLEFSSEFRIFVIFSFYKMIIRTRPAKMPPNSIYK